MTLKSDNVIPRTVLDSFRLPLDSFEELSGGSRPVFRVGDAVLKKIHATSLESDHSLELAPWLQEQLASIKENGFRIARPITSSTGTWIVEDGWSAVTFLGGRPASSTDLPEVIAATQAMLMAVRYIPKHPLLDCNTTPWGIAHRACLQLERPKNVHTLLCSLIEAHYERLKPVELPEFRLIHGDLNLGNVIVSSGKPPGFLDFTPFWGPPELGLAILANWAGPRRGNAEILPLFESIPNFQQMLLRASLRMLIIVSEFNGVLGWQQAPEKRAAEIVLDYTS